MKKSHHYFFALAFALFVVGIFLRTYEFEGFVRFLSDEGRDAIIVRNIVTFTHFPAIGAPSSVGQVYLGPFYYYLIAPFLPLFFFNPVGLAYGSLFYSLVGIGASFIIIRKELGNSIALLSLFMMVTSITLIEFARFSWNPNLLPYFSFITLYFFYQWRQTKMLKYSVLFGMFFGLTIQLHYLAVFILIPIAVFVLWDLLSIKQYKKLILSLLPAIGSFIFFISPLIFFDIKHKFININQAMKLFSQGELSSNSPYLTRLGETAQGFVQYTFAAETPVVVASIILLVILILGVRATYTKKSTFMMMHVLTLVAFVLGFAVLGNARYAHYYAAIYLHAYVVVAYITYSFANRFVRTISVSMLCAGILVLNIPTYYFFTAEPINQIQYAKEAAESFEGKIQNGPIQMVTIPQSSSDTQVRYFLELNGHELLPQHSPEQPNELYVVCHEECTPQDDPQWQIASFTNKAVETHWTFKDVEIYKIVHSP